MFLWVEDEYQYHETRWYRLLDHLSIQINKSIICWLYFKTPLFVYEFVLVKILDVFTVFLGTVSSCT